MWSPSRRSQVPPFLVMDVMEAADQEERRGRKILHLEVGQPGTPAPRAVREAAHAAIDSEQLGYTRATGIWSLREKIAEHYQRTHGANIDPESVIVTSGASGAFVLAFVAAFAPGARVGLSVPGYPCYANILEALDLQPVFSRVGAKSGYCLTPEHIEDLDTALDGLIVASPANPTGSMLDPTSLGRLLTYCEDRGIVAIVDEIYHGLIFGDAPQRTAAGFGNGTITVGSFSKYYSMTGWRLGWMVVPEGYRRTMEILSQNMAICAPAVSQYAALAAFDTSDELDAHVARYADNRKALLVALRRAGVTDTAPADGAFYVYADVSAFTSDSQQLCAEMLRDIGVAATSGVDFDRERGHEMVRFSYCRSREDVAEAARRIEHFLTAKRR